MSRDEDRQIDPMDSIFDTDFGALPVSPTGSFIPNTQVFEPDPIMPATPDNMICLRGPCRHYLEMRPIFGAGNTKGTLDKAPVQIHRSCMVIPGYEVTLTDENMMDCNRWEPMSLREIRKLERRRENYQKREDAKKEAK